MFYFVMQSLAKGSPRVRGSSNVAADKERNIFDRIFDVAIELAEEGGYDNVRQRDVAARAGVALGTLYKRFRSKEDILSAALERETAQLERKLEKLPVKAATAEDRLIQFYTVLTKALTKRPHFARAVLRAMASGQPEVAKHVLAYQGRMNAMLIATMRGGGRMSYSDATVSPPTEKEQTLALLLQQNWFASLIGWSAGMHSPSEVIEHVRMAARLLLKGMEK
jgi:TetR/AcrR family transcriptional regulator, cholesterol catabolism regulator